MGTDAPQPEALLEEIRRLKWRISTLESAEYECARAINALAASEARYRRLLEEAGFPITIAAASDSSLLYANPLACRFFGLEGPPFGHHRMLEFYVRPGDRDQFLARLRSEGMVRDVELLLRNGEGKPRAVIVSASLVTYEGQAAILATSNDITERRHAEDLFRTAIEASPDGFVLCDLEGRITYASPQTLRQFGYGAADAVVGHRLMDFIPNQERPQAEERLATILRGGDARPSEWTGLHREGGTLPWEINAGLLRNPDGSPYACFLILRDLVPRRRVERAIRWAEKLESLGLMAAGIAHELNNAFQVTQGNLELAQELCSATEPIAGILAKIGSGVDRATALAREMLDYSGRTLRGDEPLDANRMVEEGLAFLREFLTSDACLVFVPGKDLPTAQGDEGQLIKVLSALVTNAVEAMGGMGGTVVIETRLQDLAEKALDSGFWPAPPRAGRFLCLEVRDTGEGIPKDRLERVCDPFFTTRGQGRGLGLSAALGILRAHSACLQIASKAGEGTTVRAFLPVSVQTHALPVPTTEVHVPVGGVLVADDDDSIRELVTAQLRTWGFQPVFAARNGAEALDLFEAHPEAIGIVLTDASMPQMTGPQAFEAMRKLKPGLVGLLMTGYSDAFCQGTATAFGFADFLNKPFRFRELKAKLEGLKAGASLRSEGRP